jgi:hypothetical protein
LPPPMFRIMSRLPEASVRVLLAPNPGKAPLFDPGAAVEGPFFLLAARKLKRVCPIPLSSLYRAEGMTLVKPLAASCDYEHSQAAR